MTDVYTTLYPSEYDEDYVHQPAITATVHAPDGTHIADLPRTEVISWTDQLDPLGAGEVTVPMDDERVTADTTADGVLVVIRSDGQPVWGLLHAPTERPRTLVGGGPRSLTLAGSDALDLLRWAGVYPERGASGKEPQHRPLNWASKDWVEWAHGPQWVAPTAHGSLSAPANPTWLAMWDEVKADLGLLAFVRWVWSGPALGGGAPAYIYSPFSAWFRRSITLASAQQVRVYATADDEILVMIDGVEHVRTEGPGQWRRLHSADFWLEVGTHQIAIRATNIPRPGGTYDPASAAGMAFALCSVANGEPSSILVSTSDTGWLSVGNVDPPGMTPGRSIGTLLADAQARGCISGVTKDFNDEAATPRPGKSLGEEWLQDEDRTVDCTRSLLDAVTAIASSTIDVKMHLEPSGRNVIPTLQVWGHNRRYQDLTTGDAPVVLRAGRDIISMTGETTGTIANALRADTPEGWATASDAPSITTHGRREEAVRLGEHAQPVSATRQLDAQLAARRVVQAVATVVLADSAVVRPYQAFHCGDLILAPDYTDSATYARWRVLSISGRVTADTNRPEWTLELGPPL